MTYSQSAWSVFMLLGLLVPYTSASEDVKCEVVTIQEQGISLVCEARNPSKECAKAGMQDVEECASLILDIPKSEWPAEWSGPRSVGSSFHIHLDPSGRSGYIQAFVPSIHEDETSCEVEDPLDPSVVFIPSFNWCKVLP